MRIKVFLVWIFSSFAFSQDGDYLTKAFLLKTFHRLSQHKDEPSLLSIFSFHKEYEKNFLKKTIGVDYSEIFSPPQSWNGDFEQYNEFYKRTDLQKFHDKIFARRVVCKKIFTKDGKQFLVRDGLEHWNDHLPDDYKGNDVLSFSYCLGEDLNEDPDRVLYYFHGASGSPANFIDRKAIAEIREVWRKEGKFPRWASVSLGKLTTLIERGKEEQFIKIVAPYIEKQLGFSEEHPVKQRFGLGLSMGGANVTHLLLKQKTFLSSAFLICPAISYVDNMTSKSAYKLYMHASNAWRSVVNIALHLAPDEYNDMDYFLTVDPLIVGQNTLDPNTPPFHIQASSLDEFGFNGGARLFAMLAKTLKAPVSFDELEGRHCVLKPKKIVEFFKSHIH